MLLDFAWHRLADRIVRRWVYILSAPPGFVLSLAEFSAPPEVTQESPKRRKEPDGNGAIVNRFLPVRSRAQTEAESFPALQAGWPAQPVYEQ